MLSNCITKFKQLFSTLEKESYVQTLQQVSSMEKLYGVLGLTASALIRFNLSIDKYVFCKPLKFYIEPDTLVSGSVTTAYLHTCLESENTMIRKYVYATH